MISFLDSSFQLPDDAGLRAAKAAGLNGWAGYLTSKPGVGLAAFWPKSNFDRIKAAGLLTMAYCSGWDDPAACRAQAAAWGVTICLDLEGGIRGAGAWTQPWLNAAGSGLYGLAADHGYSAPFHILAGYWGFDPKDTWRGAPPSGPHGYQWQGTHTEFGCSVDRCWFDDSLAALLGGAQIQGDFLAALSDQQQQDMFNYIKDGRTGSGESVPQQILGQIRKTLGDTYNEVDARTGLVVNTMGADVAEILAAIKDLKADVDTIKAAQATGVPPGTTFTATTK